MAKVEIHKNSKHSRPPKNYCFVCGQDNREGMRLKFTYDEDGKRFLCRFRLSRRYVGPPGHVHGGIIATILDEVMGKVNKIRHVTAVTAEMTVNYLKPVPLRQPLVAEAHELSVRGRVHTNVGEIRNEKGEVLARAKGTFIAIDPYQVFKKHITPHYGTGLMRPLSAEKRSQARRAR